LRHVTNLGKKYYVDELEIAITNIKKLFQGKLYGSNSLYSDLYIRSLGFNVKIYLPFQLTS